MRILKLVSLLFFLAFLQVSGWAQCKTIEKWAEKRSGLRKLCFYPTTLRMVNLSKDESFNQMVKDIDKLKVIISDKTGSIAKEDVAFLKKGIRSENYKDMLQVNKGKESFSVFIKEENDKPVGFAGIIYSKDSFILVDLEGYLSPEVIQQIMNGKINQGAISKLFDITKSGKKNPK
jgi:hypothetical protein